MYIMFMANALFVIRETLQKGDMMSELEQIIVAIIYIAVPSAIFFGLWYFGRNPTKR